MHEITICCAKVIKALIKIRAQDPTALEEFETTLDTYRRALGI